MSSEAKPTSFAPDGNLAAPGSLAFAGSLAANGGFAFLPPQPAAFLRVNVAYHTTNLRVALADKRVFDELVVEVVNRVRTRVPQHELFAVMVADARNRIEELAAAYANRPRHVDGRAISAAVMVAAPGVGGEAPATL